MSKKEETVDASPLIGIIILAFIGTTIYWAVNHDWSSNNDGDHIPTPSEKIEKQFRDSYENTAEWQSDCHVWQTLHQITSHTATSHKCTDQEPNCETGTWVPDPGSYGFTMRKQGPTGFVYDVTCKFVSNYGDFVPWKNPKSIF